MYMHYGSAPILLWQMNAYSAQLVRTTWKEASGTHMGHRAVLARRQLDSALNVHRVLHAMVETACSRWRAGIARRPG